VVKRPAGREGDHENNRHWSGKLDGVRRQILGLQSPQMRHHDGEAVDAVKGESFMGAIEGLEESR
jgi:hypothetical protein